MSGDKGKSEFKRYSASIDRSKDAVSRILLTHIYIENLLERYISTKVKKANKLFGKNGLSFIQKLNLVAAYGELTNQEYDSINKLNILRNNYAHEFEYEMEPKILEDLGRTIGKNYKDFTDVCSDNDILLCRVLSYISGTISRLAADAENGKT